MNLETYFENLREYILEKHPDVNDAETVLDMIYECYAQLNRMDNETIRKDFDELYQAMHGHSLREIDKIIDGLSRLSVRTNAQALCACAV